MTQHLKLDLNVFGDEIFQTVNQVQNSISNLSSTEVNLKTIHSENAINWEILQIGILLVQ